MNSLIYLIVLVISFFEIHVSRATVEFSLKDPTVSGYRVEECPKGWVRFNTEKCFKIFTKNSKTHTEAELDCEEQGSTLASIRNIEEDKFLISYVIKNTNIEKQNEFWLGGIEKNSKLFWSDHTPFEYTNWRYVRRNKDADACVYMVSGSELLKDSVNTSMGTKSCSESLPYICQKYQKDSRRIYFIRTSKSGDSDNEESFLPEDIATGNRKGKTLVLYKTTQGTESFSDEPFLEIDKSSNQRRAGGRGINRTTIISTSTYTIVDHHNKQPDESSEKVPTEESKNTIGDESSKHKDIHTTSKTTTTKKPSTSSKPKSGIKRANTFSSVYAQAGRGIGGYLLRSTDDRGFAFDYEHSGKLDYIVLYRPGTGTIWIIKNKGDGKFAPVYAAGDSGVGIGGFDFKSTADLAFPFDYESSGNQDYLVLYRPGGGIIMILKNTDGIFTPVFGEKELGIGGYDLMWDEDRGFAFDYDHSGKLDHLVFYRPGTGAIWIFKNLDGNFTSVYGKDNLDKGIGGYDLKSKSDQAFAYDYDSSGNMDHIVLYRPGTGTIWILKNSEGIFSPVYQEGPTPHGTGIGEYDLRNKVDLAFAFDYSGHGLQNHIALYRPGTGSFWILKNKKGKFKSVYKEADPGKGLGGYDLKAVEDRAFPFDYEHTGNTDYVVFYRPGQGTFWIIKHDNLNITTATTVND